ncbi:MAG: hypothetical protein PHN60_04675 [Candidatus Gracilibacteria bacterium]|nr:hypothetical protein [Candidatus Gracilibacteria bacterium]
MHILLKFVVIVLSFCFTVDVFATSKITSETEDISMETVSNESISLALSNNTGSATASGVTNNSSTEKDEINDKKSSISQQETRDEASMVEQETEEQKKDKEKTINDINTFLIESYKIKIDKILANLNISLERVTNNNPAAQSKLLEKIRGDISTKIQIINSRNISENRKKILSSVFSYIQENLNTKIFRLAQQK